MESKRKNKQSNSRKRENWTGKANPKDHHGRHCSLLSLLKPAAVQEEEKQWERENEIFIYILKNNVSNYYANQQL